MSTRPSVGRRIAAAVLGVERPGRRARDLPVPRDLPFGRRLLAAVLGVRVGAGARQISAATRDPAETRAGAEASAGSFAKAYSRVSADETPPPARTGAADRRDPPAPRTTYRPARAKVRDESPEPLEPEEPPYTPPPSWRPAISYPGAGAGASSVPQYLHSEDRQEYERLVDEALRSAPHRPELAAVGQRLNAEQLRTMALNATALITAAAATEYQHYVQVREEQRRPAPSAGEPGSTAPGADGPGVIAVVAVLSPVLAGAAAAIFLLVGSILKMFDPEPAFAQAVLTTGWVFGAVTAAAILVAAVGLLLTALRDGSSPGPGPYGEPSEEVARAREAWREALLERGILPFLREALADPGTAALHHPPPPAPAARMPKLGYDRPGVSSPDDLPPAGPRPRFSTPDFTSPDYGGPEHRPD